MQRQQGRPSSSGAAVLAAVAGPVALLLVFLCGVQLVAAVPTVTLRLVGYSPSYQLRAEDFWTEPPVFEITLSDLSATTPEFFDSSITANVATFVGAAVQANGSVPSGIQAHKVAIFTGVAIVNATTLRVTPATTSLLGFTHPLYVDRLRFSFAASTIGNYSGSAVVTDYRNIQGLTTAGSAAFRDTEASTRSLSELSIRLTGLVVRVDLQFNDFPAAANDSVIITSNEPLLQSSRGLWVVSLPTGPATLPTAALIFTLPPLPTFNVSAPVWLHFQVNTSRVRIALPVSPDSANFTIATVDGAPLAFCTVANTTITEAELRSVGSSGVIREVSLAPTTSDAFITGPNRTEIDSWILASVDVNPTRFDVTVAAVTASVITLNISAKDGAAYDTDFSFPISIVIQPRLLQSKEAGCGQTFLSIVPSPGIVTCISNASDRTKTELEVNDSPWTMEFEVQFDKFVGAPAFDAIAALAPADATASGAEHFGYEATMKGKATVVAVTTSTNSITRVRIQFPRTERFNIPLNSTEFITISFPASALVSGVVPVMRDASFNVTSVKPFFNVTFDGDINAGFVTVKQLWQTGANMSLNLRGDTWDVNGRNLWNVNHPRLAGSITNGDELYSMQQTIDRVGGLINVLDYASVNITLRVATLPIRPLPGLSVRTDERVRVQKLSQLILGLASDAATVAQENFDLVQIKPNDLRVTFGGVATPGRVVGEKDFRSGFWFSMTLNLNVYKVNSTLWNTQLFPHVTSLTPYLSTCNATRDPAWVYNFSCPAMPTFDIDKDELISIVTPKEFYYEVLPLQEATATIGVIAAPAPTCVWNADFSFTEGDLRNTDGSGGFFIEVRSTEPFSDNVDTLNMTVGTIVKSTHQASHPIRITVKPRFLPLFLQLVVEPDPSYEIDTNDVVTVHLDRFFFDIKERCNPLNFTVRVLPGTGFGTNVTTNTPASAVRDGDVKFVMTLVGERVVGPQFNFTLAVTYPSAVPGGAARATRTIGVASGLPTYGFENALAVTPGQPITYFVTARAITNWTDTALNATVFEASLPRIPGYKILQPENLTLAIPGTAVASGVDPILRDSSFIFYPSSSRVNATFNATIPEALITSGGGDPLRIELLDDYWNTTTTPDLIRAGMRRTGANGSTLSDLATGSMQAIFNLAAFAFPSPDVLVITRSRDDAYDAPADEDLVLYFTAAMTVTGLAPARPNVTIRVIAGLPRLVATGSALNAGSRAYILGGLNLELYLENDLFVKNALSPGDVCPFGQCSISVDNTGRTLSVNFEATTSTVLIANATFNVTIKAEAVRSNATLNNITLHITLEPGIATLSFTDALTTTTESVVSEGKLPALLLNVIGDRFVNDRVLLAQALAEGTVCFPASDGFGFCSRARAIFTTIDVRFFTRQTVTLTLQADDSYDIASNEIVNITIGSRGMESGLAPSGWVALTVTPVRGKYYFSTTAATVPSATLTTSDTIDVTVTITLRNERFVSYPTAAVIAGSRSALSASDEPLGYDHFKTSMYHQGVLSDDQRTLRLSMKRTPDYAARSDEAVTFAVSADAVRSSFAPSLASSGPATVLIERSGGHLTLESPSVTTAARVRLSGINITVTSTDRWQAVFISGLSPTQIRGIISSDKAPAEEPAGFEALKSVMLSRTITVESNRLDLSIAPASGYALQTDELITFAFNDPRWGSLNRRLVPSEITILVKANEIANAETIRFYVSPAMTEGEFQRLLSSFVGITTDRVIVVSRAPFPPAKLSYQIIEVNVVAAGAGAPSDARTPHEVTDFLLASDEGLVQRLLNVTALERASAPMDEPVLLKKLGIVVPDSFRREPQSLIWAWCAIAALVVAAIIAAAYYHLRVKGTMIAPTASDARRAPLLKVKGGNGAFDFDDDENDDDGGDIHLGDSPPLDKSKNGFGDDGWSPERGGRMSPSMERSASPNAAVETSTTMSRPKPRPANADAALDELMLSTGGRANRITAASTASLAGASLSAAAPSGAGSAGTGTAAAGGVGGAYAAARPFTDNDAAIAGPSLAGRRARDVRIDLDEYVTSRQPGTFLRPQVEPLQLPPLTRLPDGPLPGGANVTIYPPGTPARRKFNATTIDTRTL